MKKTTTKTSTPVTKAVKAPAAPAVTLAPAKKSAPAKKKAAPATAPLVTSISAKVDIGFGNHLFVRGDGPGLSWDKGVAMECSSNLVWSTDIKGATAPVIFKVLVNDLTWSTGKDYVVEPGQSVTITPTF